MLLSTLPGCRNRNATVDLQREQLFTLEYGVLEDQLNLFSLDGNAPPLKTGLAMRDGIFFVANGNAAKVLTLSSFGDLLSMVYNPERNPQPVTLTTGEGESSARGRIARAYPFASPGEVAVDSQRTIFVEDRVPENRRSFDDAINASLEYVILRFSRDGEYLDYLGQEGLGGTPFPRIEKVFITRNDQCVVVSLTGKGWTTFRFNPDGSLVSTISVDRVDLPRPADSKELIPSMGGIAASPVTGDLVMKVDYYRELIDTETRTQSGIEFDSSVAWIMDGTTGMYTDRYDLPTFQTMAGRDKDDPGIQRAWDLVGLAGTTIFMTAADENGATFFNLYNMATKTSARYSLRIDPEELLYTAYSLSPEGILSAMLCSEYEARFVWWRFDRMTGGFVP